MRQDVGVNVDDHGWPLVHLLFLDGLGLGGLGWLKEPDFSAPSRVHGGVEKPEKCRLKTQPRRADRIENITGGYISF
jgi:hypothetical protein